MREKERVIVWGNGQVYREHKTDIESKFNIVAYTDRKYKNRDELPLKCILPEDICSFTFDKMEILDKAADETESLKEIIHDMEVYKHLNTDNKFHIDDNDLKIMTCDKNLPAGMPASHYFAQDIWGAEKIYKNNPALHYDIGSRLDGFIAHLLVFREVNYIDIRPLPFDIPRLHFIQSDATRLEQFEDGSVESLSSFHAIEHFGLGRYGDQIDPDAYVRAAENIQRIIKCGGRLYLGVPIGTKDRLVFNAHRIFSIETIKKIFNKMKLQDMAIVKKDHAYVEKLTDCEDIGEYTCGLFEFVKM